MITDYEQTAHHKSDSDPRGMLLTRIVRLSLTIMVTNVFPSTPGSSSSIFSPGPALRLSHTIHDADSHSPEPPSPLIFSRKRALEPIVSVSSRAVSSGEDALHHTAKRQKVLNTPVSFPSQSQSSHCTDLCISKVQH